MHVVVYRPSTLGFQQYKVHGDIAYDVDFVGDCALGAAAKNDHAKIEAAGTEIYEPFGESSLVVVKTVVSERISPIKQTCYVKVSLSHTHLPYVVVTGTTEEVFRGLRGRVTVLRASHQRLGRQLCVPSYPSRLRCCWVCVRANYPPLSRCASADFHRRQPTGPDCGRWARPWAALCARTFAGGCGGGRGVAVVAEGPDRGAGVAEPHPLVR